MMMHRHLNPAHASGRSHAVPMCGSAMTCSVDDISNASPSGSLTAADREVVSCPVCEASDHRPERQISGWELVRCRRCAMVFVNPQPTDAALMAAYNGQGEFAYAVGGHLDKASFYETWFGPRDFERWRSHLRRMARRCGGGRLLEYGCGPALVGRVAAEEGWQVEAIDVGAWIRELQPQRAFPLHVGTLREQRWPDGRFDAIYAQDVFEHLRRPRDELCEIARLLRPGGVLFVHVPNYASLTIRLGVSRFGYNEPPSHLNYFTPATLRGMLRAAGFSRIELSSDHLEYQDFWKREAFDYAGFEKGIAATGRPVAGRGWGLARALVNIPLGLFRCGTYLWGYAVRGSAPPTNDQSKTGDQQQGR
jgi:SAM-dependent methyltransferase